MTVQVWRLFRLAKDQMIGALILVGSLAVLGVYAYMLYAGFAWLVYGIVVTVAMIGVMGVVAWIGWTMATTPPPAPIEAFDDPQKSPEEASEKT